jgi:hypothetical protein
MPFATCSSAEMVLLVLRVLADCGRTVLFDFEESDCMSSMDGWIGRITLRLLDSPRSTEGRDAEEGAGDFCILEGETGLLLITG